MTSAHNTIDRVKLAKVLARLASPHEGEVGAAANRAVAIVQSSGLTWEEVLATAAVQQLEAEPDWMDDVESWAWRDQAHFALKRQRFLNHWERDFLTSLLGFSDLSPRQYDKLGVIVDRVVAKSKQRRRA